MSEPRYPNLQPMEVLENYRAQLEGLRASVHVQLLNLVEAARQQPVGTAEQMAADLSHLVTKEAEFALGIQLLLHINPEDVR